MEELQVIIGANKVMVALNELNEYMIRNSEIENKEERDMDDTTLYKEALLVDYVEEAKENITKLVDVLQKTNEELERECRDKGKTINEATLEIVLKNLRGRV